MTTDSRLQNIVDNIDGDGGISESEEIAIELHGLRQLHIELKNDIKQVIIYLQKLLDA